MMIEEALPLASAVYDEAQKKKVLLVPDLTVKSSKHEFYNI